jgi:hypothetical protein
MTTPRTNHTATLLLNGKVLITGGIAARPASAELYDPVTGTFTATGDMTTGRRSHTATLLPDGRVLLTGGYYFGSLASAELYDPVTGTFTATGNMGTAQSNHKATLLNNGKVLITGEAIEPSGTSANPELYDPITGTFAATEYYADKSNTSWNEESGLSVATTALLPNGKVLIAAEPTAELYDPASSAFSFTGQMTANILGEKPVWIADRLATLLTNGKVLLAGGEEGNYGSPLASAELYDPSTGNFTAIGNMTRVREGHTATLLRDGTVLIAGSDFGPIAIASTELYDPAIGRFTATGDMTSPRVWHNATLLMDGRILITGGTTCSCASGSASAELYVPPVLVPAQVVTDLRFDRTSIGAGSAYSVNVSGFNLTSQTFFDVRFTAPGSNASDVVLNWQRGNALSHDVSLDTAAGNWTINGVRAHEIETDHTGIFFPVSATITVSPSVLVPPPVVTDLRFDRPSVVVGSSFSANVSGSNLTSQTFFDVRFTAPGSNASDVALNWQRGLEASHGVSAGTAAGGWTINGVRAHEIETDHTGSFFPVSATITVSP